MQICAKSSTINLVKVLFLFSDSTIPACLASLQSAGGDDEVDSHYIQ